MNPRLVASGLLLLLSLAAAAGQYYLACVVWGVPWFHLFALNALGSLSVSFARQSAEALS